MERGLKLFVVAALLALRCSGDVLPLLWDTTTGRVVLPTNILGMQFGGYTITNLVGFGLANSNGVLSINLGALPFQAADADLTDLADGSLTGSKVGSGIDDDNVSFDDADSLWTATTIGAALEELNDSINAGAPNGTGAKLHWSQLLGVPAGFADGSDDGSGGGSGTMTGISFVVPGPFSISPASTTTTNTFTLSVSNQTANTFYAGPTSGGAAAPTFRALVDDDVPNTITVDLATTATTANSGDSATAFFSSGTIEDARLPSGLARDSEVSATYAPLASPALTGSPTVPTASAGASNTLAASTAYVDRAVASGGGGGGGSWDGSPIASGTITNLSTETLNGNWLYDKANGDIFADGEFSQSSAGNAFFPYIGAALSSGTATVATSTYSEHPWLVTIASSSTPSSGYRYPMAAGIDVLKSGKMWEAIFYVLNTNHTFGKIGYSQLFTASESTDHFQLSITNGVAVGANASNSTYSVTPSSYTLANSTWYRVRGAIVGTSSVFSILDTNGAVLWSDTNTTRVPFGRTTLAHGVVFWNTNNVATNLVTLDAIGKKTLGKLAR